MYLHQVRYWIFSCCKAHNTTNAFLSEYSSTFDVQIWMKCQLFFCLFKFFIQSYFKPVTLQIIECLISKESFPGTKIYEISIYNKINNTNITTAHLCTYNTVLNKTIRQLKIVNFQEDGLNGIFKYYLKVRRCSVFGIYTYEDKLSCLCILDGYEICKKPSRYLCFFSNSNLVNKRR